ncbi:organic hydroperoxide resistance protein [Psychroserpens sp. NJDZ02]|uniref:organic hydroperoxide resistance protein n=1 Tax=Psychroserpens sp. NJDZ02 TaxID=2570561 RepID=UPI0010A76A01|nr:organic hydroperoxide resistance protein [Psychroserpens sp. NJDZ02]QCE42880.1 organic hydroperoxide resistance protein [Psychroserpens sp. NJDZ02]
MKATNYTAIATAKGGRSGHVKTNDGVLDLKVSVPVEFGGQDNGYTNPEQLFAAGWAACFDNALIMVAKAKKIELESTTTVEATLGALDDGSFGLSAVIKVKIDNLPTEDAKKIIEGAHRVCPYSKATKGNINVEIIQL